MLERIHFETREEWLLGRHEYKGIGASEAAAVLGLSSWMTPTELWKQKISPEPPKETDTAYTRYGTEAEEHVRALFLLKHPELALEYYPYDFLFQKERPWLRCTLDGELFSKDGEHGIYEGKTARPQTKAQWAEWNERIPDHYYTQICHQFAATGFDFAYLSAELIGVDGNSQLRTYYFRRDESLDDIEYVVENETKFWHCVEKKNMPGTILRI